ncbi:MAG: adenylate/guanylate cyclase domain-containing protein, partial [Flavobacteriales bacterium]|nr:adenylate/guanylate cyclase domain-containing protein [Flavobacteriales bacterium]
LDRAERELQREYERSELLLTTILPSSIAERLKADRENRIADSLDNVAVLFADLVGFTPAAAKVTPVELVDYLHRLFSRFDTLCEVHGVDKIKTIGDAYMAVGGLRQDGGPGVRRIGRLALDMFEVVAEETLAGHPLQLRIGIHYGPVVAGVIGDRRMTYDMWGDTVNYASRLESHGVPGRIHVSQSYRDAAPAGFTFEKRGMLDIK